MGAGNPTFRSMDLYEPETYYVEFYEYGDDEEKNYAWGCENAVRDLQASMLHQMRDNGMQFVADNEMSVSEDVQASGWHQTAYTLLFNEYASVCTTSDTTLEKIVVGLIPIERDNFIRMCECRKEFADKVKFPEYVWDNGYEHYCSTCSKERMEIVDNAINKSYDRYINDVFNPINDVFKKSLCELYPDSVYWPCGPWTSGKLVLNEERK